MSENAESLPDVIVPHALYVATVRRSEQILTERSVTERRRSITPVILAFKNFKLIMISGLLETWTVPNELHGQMLLFIFIFKQVLSIFCC